MFDPRLPPVFRRAESVTKNPHVQAAAGGAGNSAWPR